METLTLVFSLLALGAAVACWMKLHELEAALKQSDEAGKNTSGGGGGPKEPL